MDTSDAVPELVRRWREGDQEAAARLYGRYARQLLRLAEQHLSRKLSGRVDGEDVVQSVFRTFFRRSAGGEFRIGSSDQIWKLLVKITLMKVRALGRYHSAQKRAVAAEAAGPAAPDADAWLPEALARDPDPADAVAFVDQVEVLMKGLPPLYGRVLELRLQGQTPTQVARELNVSRQTVYRALNLLQERLREGMGPGGAGEPAGRPGADL